MDGVIKPGWWSNVLQQWGAGVALLLKPLKSNTGSIAWGQEGESQPPKNIIYQVHFFRNFEKFFYCKHQKQSS